MVCAQCGVRLVGHAEERVVCPRCGWSNQELNRERLEALATALAKRRERPRHPVMPDVEIERRIRAQMQLAEVLDTARPTVALIEHCHTLLQKHGISWRG